MLKNKGIGTAQSDTYTLLAVSGNQPEGPAGGQAPTPDIHAFGVNTIVGPLKWDATGDPLGTGLLTQWQNGTLQVVAPKAAATSKTIVNPKPGWSAS